MIKNLTVATPGLDQHGVQGHQPWFAASCHAGPCPARLTLSKVAQDLQTLRCPAGKRNLWWGNPSRVTRCLRGRDWLLLEPITVTEFFFFLFSKLRLTFSHSSKSGQLTFSVFKPPTFHRKKKCLLSLHCYRSASALPMALQWIRVRGEGSMALVHLSFGTACWRVPGVGVQKIDGSYSLLSFWEY